MALVGANPMLGGLALGSDSAGSEYSGWMMKAAPLLSDLDKRASIGRRFRNAGHALLRAVKQRGDLQRRFFVLDGQDLRYFKDEEKTEYAGTIELGTVRLIKRQGESLREAEAKGSRAVREDLPPYSLLLVTDARVFTLVPPSESESAQWHMRISSVLEANQRRGLVTSSLMQRAGTARPQKGGATATASSSSAAAATLFDFADVLDTTATAAEEEENVQDIQPDVSLSMQRLETSHEQCRVTPGGKPLAGHLTSREEEAKLSAVTPSLRAERRRASLVYTGRVAAKTEALRAGHAAAAEAVEEWKACYNSRPRERHPVSRWEQMTGNLPRWALSVSSSSRLHHLGVFSALVPSTDLDEEAIAGSTLFPLPGAPPSIHGDERLAVGQTGKERRQRAKAEAEETKRKTKARKGKGGMEVEVSSGPEDTTRAQRKAIKSLREDLRLLALTPSDIAHAGGLSFHLKLFAKNFLVRDGEPQTQEPASRIRRAVTARVGLYAQTARAYHAWLSQGGGEGSWQQDPWIEGAVSELIDDVLLLQEQFYPAGQSSNDEQNLFVEEEEHLDAQRLAAAEAVKIIASGGSSAEATAAVEKILVSTRASVVQRALPRMLMPGYEQGLLEESSLLEGYGSEAGRSNAQPSARRPSMALVRGSGPLLDMYQAPPTAAELSQWTASVLCMTARERSFLSTLRGQSRFFRRLKAQLSFASEKMIQTSLPQDPLGDAQLLAANGLWVPDRRSGVSSRLGLAPKPVSLSPELVSLRTRPGGSEGRQARVLIARAAPRAVDTDGEEEDVDVGTLLDDVPRGFASRQSLKWSSVKWVEFAPKAAASHAAVSTLSADALRSRTSSVVDNDDGGAAAAVRSMNRVRGRSMSISFSSLPSSIQGTQFVASLTANKRNQLRRGSPGADPQEYLASDIEVEHVPILKITASPSSSPNQALTPGAQGDMEVLQMALTRWVAEAHAPPDSVLRQAIATPAVSGATFATTLDEDSAAIAEAPPRLAVMSAEPTVEEEADAPGSPVSSVRSTPATSSRSLGRPPPAALEPASPGGNAVKKLRIRRKTMKIGTLKPDRRGSEGGGYESTSSAGPSTAADRAGGPRPPLASSGAGAQSDSDRSTSAPRPRVVPLRVPVSNRRTSASDGGNTSDDGSHERGDGHLSGSESAAAASEPEDGPSSRRPANREERVANVIAQAQARVTRREEAMLGMRQSQFSSFPRTATVPLAIGGGGGQADERWGSVAGAAAPRGMIEDAIKSIVAAAVTKEAHEALPSVESSLPGDPPSTGASGVTKAAPAIFASSAAWKGGVQQDPPPEPPSRGDPFASALRSLPLLTVPPGTLLLHPHPSGGRPPALPKGVRLLRRDAAYVLLRGRVRVISAPLEEVDEAIATTLALPLTSESQALDTPPKSPVFAAASAGGPTSVATSLAQGLLRSWGGSPIGGGSVQSPRAKRASSVAAPSAKSRSSGRRSVSAPPPREALIAPARASAASHKPAMLSLPGTAREGADRHGVDDLDYEILPDTGEASSLIAHAEAEAAGESGDGPVRGGAGPGLATEWAEIGATAAPLVFGMSQLLRGAPPSSAVVTVTGATLIVIARPSLRLLYRIQPLAAAVFPHMESFSRPDRLVACVPALRCGICDTSLSGKDEPVRQWQLVCSVGALFRPVSIPRGRVLFSPGDHGDCAYVVLAGRVALCAPRATDPNEWVLLDVAGPGRCIGEHTLVVPAPRAVRAVAMSTCILARLTHSSIRRLLSHRPRVWRAMRNSVVWREPSQMVRVPLLRWLVGGEKNQHRLASLCECWSSVTLAHAANRPFSTYPTLGQGPISVDDSSSGLSMTTILPAPPERFPAPNRSGSDTDSRTGVRAEQSGLVSTLRATMARVPSHGPLPRSLGASRAVAAHMDGLESQESTGVPLPPLSCVATPRQRESSDSIAPGFPEDVEEDEWMSLSDQAEHNAVFNTALAASLEALEEDLSSSPIPLRPATAGPQPTAPLVSHLCRRRISGEAMHSLMVIGTGSVSLHLRQEQSAVVTAREAIQAGLSLEKAAAIASGESDEAIPVQPRKLRVKSKSAQNVSTILSRGDIFGGSTLLTKLHTHAARSELTVSSKSAMAVVLLLGRSTILRWRKTLPNSSPVRLRQWYSRGMEVFGSRTSLPIFESMDLGLSADSKRALSPSLSSDERAALDQWFFGSMASSVG
jgi:hypothetical protein